MAVIPFSKKITIIVFTFGGFLSTLLVTFTINLSKNYVPATMKVELNKIFFLCKQYYFVCRGVEGYREPSKRATVIGILKF